MLLAATSGTLATRRERLATLREIEDKLVEQSQEDIVAEEVASFLFQLEVFEDVPGVGAVSGALLNLAFIRRVEITARRVFQDAGCGTTARSTRSPRRGPRLALAAGWSGALGAAAYSGCYYLGYGATLPFWFFAMRRRPSENALTRGLHDGARRGRLAGQFGSSPGRNAVPSSLRWPSPPGREIPHKFERRAG